MEFWQLLFLGKIQQEQIQASQYPIKTQCNSLHSCGPK